jgi:catechol 2,3-dioxygenase-like lactoylglutathione lyase family enzyme
MAGTAQSDRKGHWKMAKLRHIAMAVPDLEEAATFYEKTFDLKRVKQTKLRIYLSDGTINLTLLPSDDLAGDDRENFVGIHHLGFVVENTEEAEKSLAENGGRIVETPNDYVALNANKKYWDPNGVMVDISTTYWVGSK